MMKIKTVCEKTGLTEKAIRFYIKEGLIYPSIVEGFRRNSYEFSEENVADLCDISILRSAGFSIDSIKMMRSNPEKTYQLVAERQSLLAAEVYEKNKIANALSRLTSIEQSDSRELAKAVLPYVRSDDYKVKDPDKRNWGFLGMAGLVLLGIIATTIVKLGLYGFGLISAFLLIVFSIISICSGIVYYNTPRKAAMRNKIYDGKIVDVIECHGYDISFARAGGNVAGTSENGIGGLWQIVFLLWNEMRLDCHYPLVGIQIDDEYRLLQLSIGWLKDTWIIGDDMKIAVDDGCENALPLTGKWIKKKALFYMLFGIALLVVGILITMITIQSGGI